MNICPVTSHPGEIRGRIPISEVIESYETYLGSPLPEKFIEKYFVSDLTEFECSSCKLRWFEPAKLAEGDFYEWLAETFDWYYSDNTWDHSKGVELLKGYGIKSFIEFGCGGGQFIKNAQNHKMNGLGVDFSPRSIEECSRIGVTCVLPDQLSDALKQPPDALVVLQVVEHLPDPVDFIERIISRFSINHVLISVPSFESLVGYVSDPLRLPPHHYTMWGREALKALAAKLGLQCSHIIYANNSLEYFVWKQEQERGGRIPGLPKLRVSRIGYHRFRFHRFMRRDWALNAHSVMALLSTANNL